MVKRGELSFGDRLEMADGQDDIAHVERVLPDYTWTWKMPLAALQRLMKTESAAAINLLRESYLPTK